MISFSPMSVGQVATGLRWVWSSNHKDIGTIYLILAVICGVIGTSLSTIIRVELSLPSHQIFCGNHQMYNVVLTAHAFIMIFFMVMPAMIGALGNLMVPVLISGLWTRKLHHFRCAFTIDSSINQFSINWKLLFNSSGWYRIFYMKTIIL